MVGVLVALLMTGVLVALRAPAGLARTGSYHTVAAASVSGSTTITAGPPWT
jgi:hypothetical protein